MPYKETEPQKIYYTIGEVARMFNVNSSLIRFWEKEFD
ncbi:MAG: MerR family transcriptional regulator, partial [Bacteroidota bacterium]